MRRLRGWCYMKFSSDKFVHTHSMTRLASSPRTLQGKQQDVQIDEFRRRSRMAKVRSEALGHISCSFAASRLAVSAWRNSVTVVEDTYQTLFMLPAMRLEDAVDNNEGKRFFWHAQRSRDTVPQILYPLSYSSRSCHCTVLILNHQHPPVRMLVAALPCSFGFLHRGRVSRNFGSCSSRPPAC